MKISELFGKGRPLFSFEFFPPKTEAGAANLEHALAELEDLAPAFVSVTYGAGGSTRDRTVDAGDPHPARTRPSRHGPPDRDRVRTGRGRGPGRSPGRRRNREPHPPARRSARGREQLRAAGRRLRARLGSGGLHPAALRPAPVPGRRGLSRGPSPVSRPGARHAAPCDQGARRRGFHHHPDSSSTTASTSTSWRAPARPASPCPSSLASCPSPTWRRSSA